MKTIKTGESSLFLGFDVAKKVLSVGFVAKTSLFSVFDGKD